MRFHRIALPVVLLLTGLAFSQADQHNHANTTAAAQPAPATPPSPATTAPKPAAPKTEAQVSFDAIKSLSGDWEGTVETDFPGAKKALEDFGGLRVSMKVTSRGNVLVHEFQQMNTPLDASKYDHPVTMFYLDGKTIEFTFADLGGSDKYGHMHHAIFTIIDKDHHVEDWTFMLMTPQGLKPVQAKMELHRVSQRLW
jgi:hypothetical protein